MVDSDFTEARVMKPAMRSFVLDAVASALKKCDPRRVRSTLLASFHATLEIPENEEVVRQAVESSLDPRDELKSIWALETKSDLQRSSLTDLLTVDEAGIERLLSGAEHSVSRDIREALVAKALQANKLDRALILLERLSPEEFAYSEATELMLRLPPARDADKQRIFLRAMVSDRKSPSFVIGGDDFTMIIVRFWKHVSPGLALEAIHQVLDQAQTGASSKEQVRLRSDSGTLSFDNEFEYRLFELVPILKQLDNAEAERLVKDSHVTETQIRQYPEGIQSLDPTIRDTSLKAGERSDVNGSVGDPISMKNTLPKTIAAEMYHSRVQEIGRMAEDDPKEAIAAAATLPEVERSLAPRAEALLAIAKAAMKNNPSIAKEALEAMAQSLKRTDPSAQKSYWDQSSLWGEASDISRNMPDLDFARQLVTSGIQQAAHLESKDRDPDDPNMAMMAWWPSTAATLRLIGAASRISPKAALDQTEKIDDRELRVLCEIEVASQMLGTRAFRAKRMVQKKSEVWAEEGANAE